MGRKIFLIQIAVLAALISLSIGCNKTSEEIQPGPSSEEIEFSSDVEVVNLIPELEVLYTINRDARLNDSRSDSWVQCASDGTVGMVYRETGQAPAKENSFNAKTMVTNLVYKTITPGGNIIDETVTSGEGVNCSVFVYDSGNRPHIFFARSINSQQEIFYCYKSSQSQWVIERIMQFPTGTGSIILELTAACGPDDRLHLLALKTGINPMVNCLDAHKNSYLFYISNRTGSWQRELIQHFDTVYLQINVRYDGTPYWYMRMFRRQDLVVDASGYAHVVYGALVLLGSEPYPSEIRYANNISGTWNIETAVAPSDESCDAGANPSIVIDREGQVLLASTFIERVPTKSAQNSELIFSYRVGTGVWEHIVIADRADNYPGVDGGHFTGAMPHLALDNNNRPHIVFSDIASSHIMGGSVLNIGQIRYARYTGDRWQLSTLYRQSAPIDYDRVNEMHGQCLAISNDGGVQIIGQEFLSESSDDQTYNLLHLTLQ